MDNDTAVKWFIERFPLRPGDEYLRRWQTDVGSAKPAISKIQTCGFAPTNSPMQNKTWAWTWSHRPLVDGVNP